MKKQTRQVFGQYETRLGQLNDTDNVAKTFSVTPSVQQKLENKMQESSEFLSKVNIIGVGEQEGEKLGLGVSGPIASRTNTKDKERETRDLSTMDSTKYRCEQTNFDTHLSYAKLDAWAKFPDFQSRVANAILTRQALDRIVIGFNGVKVMATTDLAANPLLQDVNKGWLQHLREQAPERVLGLVAAGMPGKVIIGDVDGADYANLDAAVTDAVNLLDPWYQEDTNLVAIVGRKLLNDKYFPLVNTKQAPTETLAADIIISQKRIGGLPAARVPYFPDNAILITRFDNLSIYFQDGARRRRVVDEPKRDRIENYESSNDAYVIEDLGLAALVENIELKDK
ncbi:MULTISPECIES: phage major capsid protein, P2 family [unclassified Janthinobacterium]|uniref:phage major capsid protein, P2 family n=1 Tax=unclassified Janthinobacterium TaxID=2610881 RepID=UPI001E2B3F92|nr:MULTISPECIES: phage major capsid protein, P2 family [unclassified Janthinobacterium]MCC7641412.1 phage major capsid protein, P2 family [Janthinobacterium sp. EB271-G4-3-1]MCC7690666.1 phage major capsid protein, P2 family [Janthinobacterium sp. EB271-G4-3-2]